MGVLLGLLMGGAWFGVAYAFPPLGLMVGVICFVCGMLSYGMDGDWVGLNLSIAALGIVGAMFGMPGPP